MISNQGLLNRNLEDVEHLQRQYWSWFVLLMLDNPEPLEQLFDEMCLCLDLACENRAEVWLAGSIAHTLDLFSNSLMWMISTLKFNIKLWSYLYSPVWAGLEQEVRGWGKLNVNLSTLCNTFLQRLGSIHQAGWGLTYRAVILVLLSLSTLTAFLLLFLYLALLSYLCSLVLVRWSFEISMCRFQCRGSRNKRQPGKAHI